MIIAIDTETYEYDKAKAEYKPILDARKFTIGCAKTDKGQTYFFTEYEKMYKWLIKTINKNKKNKKRTFIYAHNTQYDWYAIAKKHFLDPKTKYICYTPFIAIHNEKGYILDTMAFYRMSLKDAAKTINQKKLEMPTNPKNIEEIKPYLEQDTQIVLDLIINLKKVIKQIGFTPRKLLTAGQLAMTSFLTHTRRNGDYYQITRYNEKTKQRHIIKTKHSEKIRQAYRGGNNTAYQIGEFKNCTQIDINGLYAYAMTKINFPKLETEQLIEQPTTEMLKIYMETEIGIAQCEIKAPNIPIGYLPIRYGGYNIFPTNKTLIGTWTYIELQTALKLGYKIKKCNWTIRWKKAERNPLKSFIKKLYQIEKNAKTKQEKQVVKLIRNNLYGKFAQNRTNKEYKTILRKDIQKWEKKGYKVTSTIENKYIMEKEKQKYEASYINPIISTLITAWSRDYMYKELTKIPKKDLLYVDTDGIIYKGNHDDKYKIGKELGLYKIETKGNVKILGEKRYYIDEKVKISGVPKRYRTKGKIKKEKSFEIDTMYGLLKAIKEGKLEKAGSFTKKEITMKPHSKNMMITPETINETSIEI